MVLEPIFARYKLLLLILLLLSLFAANTLIATSAQTNKRPAIQPALHHTRRLST